MRTGQERRANQMVRWHDGSDPGWARGPGAVSRGAAEVPQRDSPGRLSAGREKRKSAHEHYLEDTFPRTD